MCASSFRRVCNNLHWLFEEKLSTGVQRKVKKGREGKNDVSLDEECSRLVVSHHSSSLPNNSADLFR